MPNQWTNKDWSKVPWDELGIPRKRRTLIEEAGYKCSQCSWNELRTDGGCTLEVDHINGDHTDNSRSNLRVLCPNCHSLTPNYRNWGNRGNKKVSKRIRVGNVEFKLKST